MIRLASGPGGRGEVSRTPNRGGVLGPIIPISGTGSREMVNGFLRAHHYLGGLPGWKVAGALRDPENDLVIRGVVILGFPASRILLQRGFIEIRRLCLGPEAPKNAASYLLGWATRWAVANGYPRVVSYADPSASREGCPGDKHRGRIYLAANFRFDGETKDHRTDGGWGGRPTRKTDHLGPKLRFIWGS